jgi:hypothetical protein
VSRVWNYTVVDEGVREGDFWLRHPRGLAIAVVPGPTPVWLAIKDATESIVNDDLPTDVNLGALWVDKRNALLKRCSSINPVTFVSVEGGGSGPIASDTVVAQDGTGAAGVSATYSRGDHRHEDVNRPTDGQKAALAGTSGAPGGGNPYVTDADVRNTNARTPTAHSILSHTGFPGGTTDFLRADGSWVAPPGGSGASLTRINGSSGAAGADLTWQKLSANSADITSTTLTVVMTTTGVGVGTWHFRYVVIYQAAATTTGIRLAVNHTGTTGLFSAQWSQVDVSAAASTGVGDGITAAAVGGVVGAYAERVKNVGTVASVGVDVINSNIMAIVEGVVVVTVSGSLELKLATEVAGSAARLMADSFLELNKIG